MSIYRDSRRIVGTNADRVGSDAISGGWKELGRTTLGSAGDNIDVSSLSDKRYYMVLTNAIASGGSTDVAMRLNTDTGSNYASRRSIDGATDETRTSDTMGIINHFENETCLGVHYLANLSSKEKLGVGHFGLKGSAGAGNAPRRVENVGKWTNTSNAINAVNLFNNDTGSFDTGSECVVLGWDPDDTHTDNFWEQLADVSLSSASDTIDSGTLSAKKYIWFQVYAEGANTELQFRFNSDSGSNYASRRSGDGGADSTFTSQTMSKINATGGASHTACFMNGFIINNSANEKLVITHQVATEATGAGTAPRRSEGVTKWSNTSSQITSIQAINNSTGDFGSGSFIKVWGSN